MPFQYKKILVVGGSSGIGESLAEKFIQEGSSVIVTGRRQEKLDGFVNKHGKDKASAVAFDVTDLHNLPQMAKK